MLIRADLNVGYGFAALEIIPAANTETAPFFRCSQPDFNPGLALEMPAPTRAAIAGGYTRLSWYPLLQGAQGQVPVPARSTSYVTRETLGPRLRGQANFRIALRPGQHGSYTPRSAITAPKP